MLIAGVNVGQTASIGSLNGLKSLKDGATCVIRDGEILLAIAEERVSRKKHAGGYDRSLKAGLESLGLEFNELDAIVMSSCCEPILQEPYKFSNTFNKYAKNYYVVSHHLSHAFSSYFPSRFEQALIIVSDAGGNNLDQNANDNWWMYSREQSSYYVGDGISIRPIGQDFSEPYSSGLGEAYRAFTFYLGWHSFVYSAHTMALAAYGDPERYKEYKLFTLIDGTLKSSMKNDPHHPIETIIDWANKQGMELPPPRKPDEPLITHKFRQEYYDLAAFIQSETETALIEKVRFLVKKTGIRNLCIAGGVGLNCVANARILNQTPIEDIFIQPASGDTGQALGNALYGYHEIYRNRRSNRTFSPYLGIRHSFSIESIRSILNNLEVEFEIDSCIDAPQVAASLLSEGKIIGWYQGQSEYGPRALGNRSILASPHSPEIEQLCRLIKKRDYFRPFAPSILRSFVPQYFEKDISSPYMLLTATAKKVAQKLMPAVIHVDLSSRLQTVEETESPRYYRLIEHFYKITGIPAILNTSFNDSNEPIVESPEDACRAYKALNLDALFIGNLLVRKKAVRPSVVNVNQVFEYDLNSTTPEELKRRIDTHFDGEKEPRSKIALFQEYMTWAQEGRKITTVRYRENRIDYPVSFFLPLIASSAETREELYQVGYARLARIQVKKFCDLTYADAVKDGFESISELQDALQKIYGRIPDKAFVSIYTFTVSNHL